MARHYAWHQWFHPLKLVREGRWRQNGEKHFTMGLKTNTDNKKGILEFLSSVTHVRMNPEEEKSNRDYWQGLQWNHRPPTGPCPVLLSPHATMESKQVLSALRTNKLWFSVLGNILSFPHFSCFTWFPYSLNIFRKSNKATNSFFLEIRNILKMLQM